MRATRDQLRNLSVVVDVGKSEAHRTVRNYIEQVKASSRRNVPRLQNAGDLRAAALAVSTHGFFFLRCEPAFRITQGKAAVPEGGVILRRLSDHRDQFLS